MLRVQCVCRWREVYPVLSSVLLCVSGMGGVVSSRDVWFEVVVVRASLDYSRFCSPAQHFRQ